MAKKKEDYKEKVRRINVQITETNYQGLKAISALKQESMTDYINEIFADSLKKNRTAIKKFMDTIPDVDQG